MPAIDGTPTVFDKLRVGFQAITGHNPANPTDAATLAGDQRDLHQAVADLEAIFGATVQAVEASAFTDVTKFITGIATAIPVGSVTTLGEVVNAVRDSAKAIGGDIHTQVGQIESSALNTLVSAAATAAGHLKLTTN